MACQSASAVLLVRPHHFGPNDQTKLDNAFQAWESPFPLNSPIAQAGYEATNRLADALDGIGIDVHVFDDESADRPDSVFPNNWFSTHSSGRVALYPMYAQNRRSERRSDVIDFLKQNYRVHEVIDFSGMEHDGIYLEGTGSMVFDHAARIAYVAKSRRASVTALQRICTLLEYEALVFDALDRNRQPIYHTNVMMTIASEFALVGMDAIDNTDHRNLVRDHLWESGKQVLSLTFEQLGSFAGNTLELNGRDGRYLALSQRALASLSSSQIRIIERSCELLPVDVAAIERAGGSVRCMIASIHLEERVTASLPTPRAAQPDVVDFPQAI